jgi:hypothetical protein
MARAGQGANVEVIAEVSTYHVYVLFVSVLCAGNVCAVMNHLANTFVCRLQSEIGTKDGRHGDGSCSCSCQLYLLISEIILTLRSCAFISFLFQT